MKKQLIIFADRCLDSLFKTAVKRRLNGGPWAYKRRISLGEVKKACGDQRLQGDLLVQLLALFDLRNIKTDFQAEYNEIVIELDLRKMRLSTNQLLQIQQTKLNLA